MGYAPVPRLKPGFNHNTMSPTWRMAEPAGGDGGSGGRPGGGCKSASLWTPWCGGATRTPHTSLHSAYGATNNRRPTRTPSRGWMAVREMGGMPPTWSLHPTPSVCQRYFQQFKLNMAFFGCKISTQKRHEKAGLFRMVTFNRLLQLSHHLPLGHQ